MTKKERSAARKAEKERKAALKQFTCGFCARKRKFTKEGAIAHLRFHIEQEMGRSDDIRARLKAEFGVDVEA